MESFPNTQTLENPDTLTRRQLKIKTHEHLNIQAPQQQILEYANTHTVEHPNTNTQTLEHPDTLTRRQLNTQTP